MYYIYYILGIITGIIITLLFLVIKNRNTTKFMGTLFVDVTHNLAKIHLDPVDLNKPKIKRAIFNVQKVENLNTELDELSREEHIL